MHKVKEDSRLSYWIAMPGNRKARQLLFELRQEIYCRKKKWEKISDKDSCDRHSDFLLIFDGRRFIGGCRIIDGRRSALPIAKFSTEITNNSVEISRPVSCLGKNADPEIYASIFQIVHDYVIGKGYAHVYAVMRVGFLKIIKCAKIETIGAVFNYDGKGLFVPASIET